MLGPTWASSQAHSGAAPSQVSRTRAAAFGVCIHAATGHDRDAISPLRRSSSMRGWSLAKPRGADFSSSIAPIE